MIFQKKNILNFVAEKKKYLYWNNYDKNVSEYNNCVILRYFVFGSNNKNLFCLHGLTKGRKL